jgi:hypothetical protein
MRFVTPLGFLAFLSLPLILLLHLFRRRQRRVTVSSLALWRFLRPQVRGPQPRRIPITWVLLLDLLAATLFALALAGPQVILPEVPAGASHVVVVLDVSTSMLAEDVSPSRFLQALSLAESLMADVPETGAFSLITFAENVHWAVDSRRDPVDSLPLLLSAIQAGFSGANLDEALALARSIQDPALPVEIHVITDGAFSRGTESPVGEGVVWHFVGGEADNQAVMDLAIAPLSAGQMQIFARLANYGAAGVTRTLVLSDATGELGRYSLNLPAESAQPQVWTLNQPEGYIQLTLEGSDALPADDQAVFGLTGSGTSAVDLVAEKPFPLDRAVGVIPEVQLTQIPPESYGPGGSGGLTIFRDFIPIQLPAGTTLILPPPVEAIENPDLRHLGAWDFASIPANAVTQTVRDEPLLMDLDFGGVRWERVILLQSLPEGYEVLLSVADRTGVSRPVLLRGREGSTTVLMLLADLSAGNFVGHPAFPLLIHHMVESVNQAALPGALSLGSGLGLPGPSQAQSLTLTPPMGEPTGRLLEWPEVYTETTHPGVYRLSLELPDGQVVSQVVGINAGDPIESGLSPAGWAADVESESLDVDEETGRILDLAPWLLALGILALLGEAVLSWR